MHDTDDAWLLPFQRYVKEISITASVWETEYDDQVREKAGRLTDAAGRLYELHREFVRSNQIAAARKARQTWVNYARAAVYWLISLR